jgi:murein DD-endopeptidase MepM/ murein hydrolase activator NlpD
VTPSRTSLALTILLLWLSAPPAAAQELYIWTDEDGIRHLSDRRPDGDYEVEVRRAIARPETPVEMRNVGTPRAPEWRFSNRLHGPVTVAVRFSRAENVVADPALPARLVLPARTERTVVVGPLDERVGWRYGLSMRALPGAPDAEPDEAFAYRLPFDAAAGVRIGQGFGGAFSHGTPDSRYAVDFTLPAGTPVLAARGGRVMDVERWFHRTGDDRERDGPRANYVRILHEDGSMAVYAHLDYNGVEVRTGQRVAAGEVIGRSGNTGYSTGPHLHFAVQVNRDMSLVSIPFRMVAPDGRELGLDDAAASP